MSLEFPGALLDLRVTHPSARLGADRESLAPDQCQTAIFRAVARKACSAERSKAGADGLAARRCDVIARGHGHRIAHRIEQRRPVAETASFIAGKLIGHRFQFSD